MRAIRVAEVLEAISQDVRLALRQFRQSPMFAATAVISLALGVRSQLYGITPNDPASMAGAALTLALVAAIAGCVPASRREDRSDARAAVRVRPFCRQPRRARERFCFWPFRWAPRGGCGVSGGGDFPTKRS